MVDGVIDPQAPEVAPLAPSWRRHVHNTMSSNSNRLKIDYAMSQKIY